MSTIFYGFVLRLGQIAIEACLTLLIGVMVAGVLRRMVGPAGTRKLFGSGWNGLLRGWLAGMLLPVCSLGVIPVAREMRRSGVPGGTVLAFVLAAPLLNPISFLYGLTLAEPSVICCFAAASLVITTLAGLLWDRFFARNIDASECKLLAEKADAVPMPGEGPKRILSVFVTACRELTGRDLGFYAIGLLGSAMLAGAISYGSLQHTMQHADHTSPLLMAAVAVPIYSSPLPGMMKIGLMFEHGNSIGASLVLFTLGIGTSLGTLAWLLVDFGWKRIIPWFLSYVLIVLVTAYAAEPLLYDSRKKEEEHTHAFDDYTCPFPAHSVDHAPLIRLKWAEAFGPLEQTVCYGLVGMLAAGMFLRRLDRGGRAESWLTARNADTGKARPKWDVTIPGPILGGISLVGLIAFSVVGAYLYYPNRNECLDRIAAVYAEAAVATRTGDKNDAIRRLEQWDLLVRKLQVGVYIRSGGLTGEQAEAAEELREALEEVRDMLLADDLEGAKAHLILVSLKHRALKDAYPRVESRDQ